MCRAAYIPSTVTKKPKIHGVVASGKATSTKGRGGRRRGTRGDPYKEESKVVYNPHWYMGVIRYWDPFRICVLDFCVVDT